MGCPLVLETSEAGIWWKPSFFCGRWSLAGYWIAALLRGFGNSDVSRVWVIGGFSRDQFEHPRTLSFRFFRDIGKTDWFESLWWGRTGITPRAKRGVVDKRRKRDGWILEKREEYGRDDRGRLAAYWRFGVSAPRWLVVRAGAFQILTDCEWRGEIQPGRNRGDHCRTVEIYRLLYII